MTRGEIVLGLAALGLLLWSIGTPNRVLAGWLLVVGLGAAFTFGMLLTEHAQVPWEGNDE